MMPPLLIVDAIYTSPYALFNQNRAISNSRIRFRTLSNNNTGTPSSNRARGLPAYISTLISGHYEPQYVSTIARKLRSHIQTHAASYLRNSTP